MNFYKIIQNVLMTLLLGTLLMGKAQLKEYAKLDYNNPKKYVINKILIEGNTFTNERILILYTNLSYGQKITIPGEEIPEAIENLWSKGRFSNVVALIEKVEGDKINVVFKLTENPRLSKFSIKGLRKTEARTLRDELSLHAGDYVNPHLIKTTQREIKAYYMAKGYFGATSNINLKDDTAKANRKVLFMVINKGKKVKINDIIISGNNTISGNKIRRTLKKTKRKKKKLNIFKSSKFVKSTYELEKENIMALYQKNGYRDAHIVKDSIYSVGKNRVNINLDIDEGKQYFFRNITFSGNVRYHDSLLYLLLGIPKGSIYNYTNLQERLNSPMGGMDITTKYMDNGYLFFSLNAVETKVADDSIDVDIQIREGEQARVRNVTVIGNTKTSDHVILREIRTKPGDIFSKTDIQRSMRELSQLGYFNPEGMNVNPKPNPASGTVDIEYLVEERPSDQIELSGGWGGNQFGSNNTGANIVGTLGIKLTNFSTKKLGDFSKWNPLPVGDGQQLSIRAQSNGSNFESYNFSFTEPWFGGKKPTSLSFSMYNSIQWGDFDDMRIGNRAKRSERAGMRTLGATLALGKRLKWPDDYFYLNQSLSYQRYKIKDFLVFADLFDEGTANNISFNSVFGRNSIDNPIFPTSGSKLTFTFGFTPPYSLLNNKDYSTMKPQEKFKWIEYYKVKFDASFYTSPFKNFVLTTQVRTGFLNAYNKDLGAPLFERFRLGGAGLQGFTAYGADFISMRGYDDSYTSDKLGVNGSETNGTIYNKYTLEARYALSKNPNATIYGLAFVEGADVFLDYKKYNPFSLKRSTGVGVRLFMPMFGLLGLDYAWPLDDTNNKNGKFVFYIGQQF